MNAAKPRQAVKVTISLGYAEGSVATEEE
jgi:hypothetical protein